MELTILKGETGNKYKTHINYKVWIKMMNAIKKDNVDSCGKELAGVAGAKEHFTPHREKIV